MIRDGSGRQGVMAGINIATRTEWDGEEQQRAECVLRGGERRAW